MYRTIWLVKRKPGTTRQQFRDCYETRLRFLGEELIGGFALSYERYYLYPMTSDGAPPIYDAVTQICFPDRDAYERCASGVRNNPQKERIVAEDQAEILDREACVHFESQDSYSRLQPLPASGKIFRTIWFARHRAGMTHEECRAYYENKHRLLGEYLINGYAYNYDRHYLYKIASEAPDPHYTFIMEMNFQASDSMDQITANIVADPTIGKLIAEDEARFIDRDSAVHYAAELSASVLQPIEQPRN